MQIDSSQLSQLRKTDFGETFKTAQSKPNDVASAIDRGVGSQLTKGQEETGRKVPQTQKPAFREIYFLNRLALALGSPRRLPQQYI